MLVTMDKLLKKIISMGLCALRRIPKFASIEYGIYEAIEAQLSKATPDATSTFFNDIALNKHCIRDSFSKYTQYRLIEIDNMSDDDCSFLEKHGLSADFIAANKVSFNYGDGCEFFHHSVDHFDTRFQIEALKQQGIKALCPKSGALLQSNRSLLTEPGHTIFYRFIGYDCVFYLAVGRVGMGYIKHYFYFPDLQTIILIGDKDWAWLGRWEVDQFRAFLVGNWKKVLNYLNNQAIPVVCALVDQTHFAHHMWNSLTGLQMIVTEQCVSHIDKLLVTAEPMGPIDRIFPEFQADHIERLSDHELIKLALDNNLFLIRPGGTVVNDDIVRRLYRVAMEISPPALKRAAQDFRKRHWPILWATIRTGNRSWISQAEGIAAIANKLIQNYPDFALIVDGYAIPYGQQHISQHQAMLIRDEEVLTRKICNLLDKSIEIVANVGKPMFESVIYSSAVDFYLAHHGSLQNKIAWLSNKPGLVHSNKTVLSGINGTKRFYTAFTSMNNGVFPVYIDPEIVTDMPGAIIKDNLRWNDPLDHYEFDYNYAFVELVKILDAEDPRIVGPRSCPSSGDDKFCETS